MSIKVTVGQTTFVKKIVVGTPVSTAVDTLSIDDFSDFDIATKSEGQILVYDSAEGTFKNYDLLVDNGLAKEFTPGADRIILRFDSDKTPEFTGFRTKGHIVPTLDSTFDLGDSAKKFKDLYLSGGTIHLGGINLKDSDGNFGAKDSAGNPVNIDLQGSIAQIRRMFTSGGDLSYDTGAGIFQFDVEQVYTKENFDSDFNLTIDSAVLEGIGLNYSNETNTLNIDSAELESFFKQDIRGYFTASNTLNYNSTTGDFSLPQRLDSTDTPTFSKVTADSASIKELKIPDGGLGKDSARLTIGSDSDLKIFHDGSHSVIRDAGTGSLQLQTNNLSVQNATGTESQITALSGGAVSLFHNNNSKLATTAYGTTVTGTVNADSSTLTNITADSGVITDISGATLNYNNINADSAVITDISGATLNYNNIDADSARITLFSGQYLGFDSDLARSSSTQTIRGYVSATDAGGDGSFAYNNSTGVFTYTGPSASEVRSHFSAQGDLSYDSTTGVFQFDVEEVYTKANFDSDFNVAIDSATTNDLSEGSNNLYYTVARADSAAKAALLGGTGVTYDSSSGVIAIGQPVATTDNVTFNQVRGPANFIIDPATVGDNTGTVQILGNLQVEGTTTTINSTIVSINDKNIVLADSAANAAAADGAGITINGASATLTYSASGDKFVFNKPFQGQYLGFDSDFDSALTTKTTTDLAEGNNLYYTVARADSAAKAALFAVDAGGDGSFTYDSSSGVMTYTGPNSSEVRAHFTGGSGIGDSVNGNGIIKIDSSELYSLYKHDDFSDFVADEHVAHSAVSIVAGKGLTGGGNIASTRTIDIDSANVRGMFSAGGDLSYNSGTGQFSIDVEEIYTADNFDSDYILAKDSANAAVERNAHDATTKTFAVTVASKSGSHVYQGQGSGNAYYIDGTESPIVNLKLGRTYRFNLSSSDMSSHPFRFYYDAARTTQYTTNVTTAATYTEITITEATPPVLHYQCSSHGYMGHALEIGTRNLTGFTTDNLTEGGNLYYTDGRFDTRFNSKSTSNLSEGSNLYYTNARVQTFVDSAYVQERQRDSASTQAMIDSNLNNDITFGGDVTFDSAGALFFDKSFKSLKFGDNYRARFGASDDLQIYHDGDNSIVRDAGQGDLFIRGSTVRLDDTTSKDYLVGNEGGSVELFFNGNKKFETTDSGVAVTGLLSADSAVFSDRIKSRTGYFSTNNEDSSSFATVVVGERPFNDGLASLEFRNQGNTFSSKIDGAGSYLGFWTNKNSVNDYRIIANFGTADETIILKPLGTDRLTVNKYGAVVNGKITADSATISGLSFPTSDGLNNQVIRTDGAGNLSFVSVAAISGNLDSEQVISLVDSAYVQARTAAGTDSAATQAMIDSSITFQVDSAYIAARTTAGTDSAAIINLIDSAYVQARSTSQTIGTINNVKNDAFTGNASTTAFNLSVTPADSDDVLVFVNGVLQHTSTYSLSSNTITLDSAPDSSSTIDIRTHLIQSQNLSLRDFQNYIYTLSSTLDSVSGADSSGTTLTYDADKVDVYVNGARLVNGKDYTASNGSQIVFDSALTAGNIIEVVSHSKATVLEPELTTVNVALDSAGANQQVFSFSKTAFRTFKFTAQLSHSSSNNFHTEEVLLIHNGTTVAMTTFGQILLDSNLGTFDATISGSDVQLKLSPTKTNVDVKLRGVRTPV